MRETLDFIVHGIRRGWEATADALVASVMAAIATLSFLDGSWLLGGVFAVLTVAWAVLAGLSADLLYHQGIVDTLQAETRRQAARWLS